MAEVSKTIDDGHMRPFGHLFDDLVGKRPDHDALDHPLKVFSYILDGLPFAKINFRRGKIDGVTSQLMDTHVKTDAGTQGGVFKNESERLSFQ